MGRGSRVRILFLTKHLPNVFSLFHGQRKFVKTPSQLCGRLKIKLILAIRRTITSFSAVG